MVLAVNHLLADHENPGAKQKHPSIFISPRRTTRAPHRRDHLPVASRGRPLFRQTKSARRL